MRWNDIIKRKGKNVENDTWGLRGGGQISLTFRNRLITRGVGVRQSFYIHNTFL